MITGLLACGPLFPQHEDATAVSLLVLLLFKPLAYYAYIQAFRFRVSRAIPMTAFQAAKLAAIRAVIGAALVGAAVGVLRLFECASIAVLLASWVYLYVERIAVWWWMGAKLVKLRHERLLGWVVGGTMMNAAFDVALVAGTMTGIVGPAVVFAVIAGAIAMLHVTGRRTALRLRFEKAPHCRVCEYNLTGNLSGICPECGTPIVVETRPAI